MKQWGGSMDHETDEGSSCARFDELLQTASGLLHLFFALALASHTTTTQQVAHDPSAKRAMKRDRGVHWLRALAAPVTRNRAKHSDSRAVPTSVVSLDSNAASDSEAEREQFVIMGKSNKFDYTSRHNSGEKLGIIVGRDLENEAEKVKKQAGRLANKARKASISSSSSSAISNGDTKDCVIHTLDIKLAGKEIGDDGACAMFDGLEIALAQRNENASQKIVEAALALEDLNLEGNAITTRSLARLAKIIRDCATCDLKTLNLSNNHIKVDTTREREEWEDFLRSFAKCRKMRRLDLSGNVMLGSKALEIFTRVYKQEQATNASTAAGMELVESLAKNMNISDHLIPRPSSPLDPITQSGFLGHGSHEHEFLEIESVSQPRGLRSIPYITLNDIGLTDAGALWLSYVLEVHSYPHQLTSEINAVDTDTSIKTYQQTASSSGLDWSSDEPGLTRDGKNLLDKTERIRRQTMLSDQFTLSSLSLINEEGNDSFDSTKRGSVDRRPARAAKGDRRASVRSIRTNDGGEHELSELESARKKIQRAVLQQHGVLSTELWRSGLRIVIAAQILSGLGPRMRQVYTIYTGPPLWEFPINHLARCNNQTSPPVTPTSGTKENQKPIGSVGSCPADTPRRQGTYAATLTANTGATAGQLELALTDTTNSPTATTPKVILRTHRKLAFSDGTDNTIEDAVNALQFHECAQSASTPDAEEKQEKDRNPLRFVTYQENNKGMDDGANPNRNRDIRSHLPDIVMKSIATWTWTKRERSVLSDQQLSQAIKWGRSRGNFALLKEWRKMADSAQLWMLLESIGCLEYQCQ